MADVLTKKAEIDAVSMELILSIVQQELIQGMTLAPSLTDYSALVGAGMDKVKVPRAGSFTAAAKVAGTSFESQALTFTSDDIALDSHEGVFASVEGIADIQSKVDLVGEYARRMASALAVQMDTVIYNQMKLTSASSPDHRVDFANTSSLAKDDFVNAKKLLRIQNVPVTDGKLFMAISPTRESDILKLSDFVDADKWGEAAVSAKLNGVIGRAYGFNIIVSNVVSDTGCIAYHSSHVAWAQQMAPNLDTQKNLRIGGYDLLLQHIYGAKVMQGGKAGVLIGSAT